MAKTHVTDNSDVLEWLSRWITQFTFVLAVVVCVAAPLLAIQWTGRPFLGFLVEQTLIASDTSGSDWGPEQAGLGLREQLLRVAGEPLRAEDDLDSVLSQHEVGETVSVLTTLRDGTRRVHPDIALRAFPAGDVLTLFLLPYLIGLAYLGIGIWIYRTRGRSRPGRALTFFCICTAVVLCLFFDVATSHELTAIYTLAFTMLGGALISLAWRFPQEWGAVTRRSWLLAVPYIISILLAIWALLVLYDIARPYAYITAFQVAYLYTALGILLFLGTMLHRAISGASPLVRQQARIVLLGSSVAFLPMAIWFVLSSFDVDVRFNAALLLPELLLFPLAVAVAILRYRLLEMDVIVNRTLVYGALTAILAGAFTAGTLLSRYLFVALTGQDSDAAIVLTTLIVASAFVPLKNRLQIIVDRRFKHAPDTTRMLRGFGDEVQAFLAMCDPHQITKRLLQEAAVGLQAESGALSLIQDGQLRTVHTYGAWRGHAWITLPLECSGEKYGFLSLGPRQGEGWYTTQEVEALQDVLHEIAPALRLSQALGALPGLLRQENGDGDRPSVKIDPAPGRQYLHGRDQPKVKF